VRGNSARNEAHLIEPERLHRYLGHVTVPEVDRIKSAAE
jgi:hypothetical protein